MHLEAVQRSSLMQAAEGQTTAQKKSRSFRRLWRFGYIRFFNDAGVDQRCCQTADRCLVLVKAVAVRIALVSTQRCTIILPEDSPTSMFHVGVSNRTSWSSGTADAWRLEEQMLDDYMPWSDDTLNNNSCMREEGRWGQTCWIYYCRSRWRIVLGCTVAQ